jgi:hypothetical protein
MKNCKDVSLENTDRLEFISALSFNSCALDVGCIVCSDNTYLSGFLASEQGTCCIRL